MNTFTRDQLINSTTLFMEFSEHNITQVVNVLDIPNKVSKSDMAVVLFILLTGDTVPELITNRIEIDKETGEVVELLTGILSGSDRFLDMELLKIYVSKAFGTSWILLTKEQAEINDINNIRTQLFVQMFEIKKEWLLRFLADQQIEYVSPEATNLILDRKSN